MKRSLIACWLWLLIASVAIAGNPTIVGPTEITPGDLAVFRVADVPNGQRGVWRVWPASAEANALPVLMPDGGTGLVYASRTPQTILIIYAYSVNGDAGLLLHECRNGTSPSPKPDPTPTPTPTPTPIGSRIIVWIEETAERTQAQAAAIADKTARDAIARAGWRLRVVDKDVTDELGQTPSELREIITMATQRGLPELYVVDADGRAWWLEAPTSVTQWRDMLRQFGLLTATECRSGVCPAR